MIIFTAHALMKLKQRSITKGLVLEVLKHPDYRVRSYGDRILVYKKFKRLYLKVVYREERKHIVVLTQHWDSTFKPRV